MDRYIVREPRAVYPGSAGQQIPNFPQHPQQNTPVAYFYDGNYQRETPASHQQVNMMRPYITHRSPSFPPSGINVNVQHQSGYVTGIDPACHTGYGNAAYILPGEPNNEIMPSYVQNNYQNHIRSNVETEGGFNQHVVQELRQGFQYKSSYGNNQTRPPINTRSGSFSATESFTYDKIQGIGIHDEENSWTLDANPRFDKQVYQKVPTNNNYTNKKNITETVTTQKPAQTVAVAIDSKRTFSKDNTDVLTMTRADKIKALHKSGSRTFSGPVEKVLKWHKGLQDLGLMIFYEIVAKCVSIRQGDSCAKHLVVRDDNGPAMQVVYFEVDFLLPELKPPCTVRVIGKMMSGTSRIQAYNVRVATGDDVAMLPRRAAVSAHHVSKITNQFQDTA